jgi:hypothetical protein
LGCAGAGARRKQIALLDDMLLDSMWLERLRTALRRLEFEPEGRAAA